MSKYDYEQAYEQEMEELQLDEAQDGQDESNLNQYEWGEAMGDGIGVPSPEKQYNQHAFISESLGQNSPEKITFLTQSELGNPLFNMRFLLDMEDICIYYLNKLVKKYNSRDLISPYFRAKIKNVADSGLSKEGFIQNMNISKRLDVKRTRPNAIDNLKGGQRSQ